MKLILENWRKHLDEGMKTPEDLPEDAEIVIQVDRVGSQTFYFIFFDNSSSISGELVIAKQEDGTWTSHIEEDVTSGWGPLLYDIGMELATKHGKGLRPDPAGPSPAASRVWSHYYNSRDVAIRPQKGESKGDPLKQIYKAKRLTRLGQLKKMGKLIER